eukprot:5936154-Pleurochrysis_carterae.AAC.1
MSALASAFKSYLLLANKLFTCRIVVLFKTFHLLTGCAENQTTGQKLNIGPQQLLMATTMALAPSIGVV